jgi:drug/metabolite transporter (DMT)-like permease
VPLFVLLPVLLSAALHATWNALVKHGTDRFLDMFLVVMGSAAIASCCVGFLPLPARPCWIYLIASAVIHVGYFVLVALAYHHGEMSLVYPLTRGSAPPLTALTSIALLNESPSIGGWLGIVLVSGGVLLLATDLRQRGSAHAMPVALALTNAAVVVTYTLIDGTGARLSGNAFAYSSWMAILTAGMFASVVFAIRGRKAVGRIVSGRWKGLGGGFCTLASYSLVLWAMTLAPISLVAAMRETSIVFGTAIAFAFLGERISWVRCASVSIVTTGAIFIKLF